MLEPPVPGDAAAAHPVVIQRFRDAYHAIRLQEHAAGGGNLLMHFSYRETNVCEAGFVPKFVPDDPADLIAGEGFHRFFLRQDAGRGQICLPQIPVFPEPAADGNLRAVLLQGAQQAFIQLRLQPVVAVHESQLVPPRVLDAQVAGGGQAAVFRVEGPDAGVCGGVAVADRPAAIRGAVVDQEDLQVGVGLGHNPVRSR